MATSSRSRRPLLALASLAVVVAVPTVLAFAGGSDSAAKPAPQTVLASARSPITAASVQVDATHPANVADTTAPTTPPPPPPPPTTQPPTTVPPTEPPTTQPPTTEPPTTEAPAPAPSSGSGGGGGETMTVSATGYCGGGTTASGESAHEGGVAMNAAPLGSTWQVLGSGSTYTVNDRIGSGSDFDIYFSSCSDADAFGRQTLTIQRVG